MGASLASVAMTQLERNPQGAKKTQTHGRGVLSFYWAFSAQALKRPKSRH